MYNKSQGRNNHGRTIVLPNPPKPQPQFHMATIQPSGIAMAITSRGLEQSTHPGVWKLIWPYYQPYYLDVAVARNYNLHNN